MSAAQHRVLSWDWREQPDLDALAAAVLELSSGRVHVTRVDTGSDQYAIVVSTVPLDAEQALRAYEARWGDCS